MKTLECSPYTHINYNIIHTVQKWHSSNEIKCRDKYVERACMPCRPTYTFINYKEKTSLQRRAPSHCSVTITQFPPFHALIFNSTVLLKCTSLQRIIAADTINAVSCSISRFNLLNFSSCHEWKFVADFILHTNSIHDIFNGWKLLQSKDQKYVIFNYKKNEIILLPLYIGSNTKNTRTTLTIH